MQKINARVSLYYKCFNCICVITIMIIIIMMILILILILILMMILILILTRVTLRVRIAKRVGECSYCRGGIVNTRGGCICALFVRRDSPTALWRFRASTSNNLSGRDWPPTHTSMRYIYQTYAQQDIRVYEDDHLEPPNRQFSNPKALSLLRVSI